MYENCSKNNNILKFQDSSVHVTYMLENLDSFNYKVDFKREKNCFPCVACLYSPISDLHFTFQVLSMYT